MDLVLKQGLLSGTGTHLREALLAVEYVEYVESVQESHILHSLWICRRSQVSDGSLPYRPYPSIS